MNRIRTREIERPAGRASLHFGGRARRAAALGIAALAAALAAPVALAAVTYQYLYDDAGRLAGVVDSSGTALQYVYDGAGNLVRILRISSGQPTIFSFSPHAGAPGTVVTLTGIGFGTGVTSVTFNGMPGTGVTSTATTVTATVPNGATTGPITINTPHGPATTSTPFTVGSVTVTPPARWLLPGGKAQFTAAVAPAALGQAVVWSVDGIPGGSQAVGTITPAGLYTAPNIALPVTIQAASQAAPALMGSAHVTVVHVASTFPGAGMKVGFIDSVSATLDGPIDAATVAAGDVTLFGAGPDGMIGTADDVPMGGGTISYAAATRTLVLTLTTPVLAPGLYEGVVAPGGGGPGQLGVTAWTFTVLPLHLEGTIPRATGGILELHGTSGTLTATFNKPLDPATLTDATFQLFAPGPDGMIGTADDVQVTGGTLSVDASKRTAFLTVNGLAPGPYRAMIRRPLSDAIGGLVDADFGWAFQAMTVPEVALAGGISVMVGPGPTMTSLPAVALAGGVSVQVGPVATAAVPPTVAIGGGVSVQVGPVATAAVPPTVAIGGGVSVQVGPATNAAIPPGVALGPGVSVQVGPAPNATTPPAVAISRGVSVTKG